MLRRSVHGIIGPLLKMTNAERYQFTRMTCNLVKNMRQLKKPILAAVNGIAAGADAMLMLASDLRIFSDQARVTFLFVKVGLSGANMGALHLLPRIVGLGKATELVSSAIPLMPLRLIASVWLIALCRRTN
ncbi:MAG TPA: enoyl-CoA hydratase-related protein [Candidatus Binatia bacterium]|nr:enoyl-CoA hydratase-related protein [Candidatus Binatia bacterium]